MLRISELGRRVGVKPERLRAWESRYGLLQPLRSDAGYRLYSDEDERRVREMLRELARGLAPAEAAAAALVSREPLQQAEPLDGIAERLIETLMQFDGPRAHDVLDELLARVTLETALQAVVVPCLHEIGERWARNELSVAQEHFASRLLEARLLALGRGWERAGAGPAVLGCAPGELHTLGLVAFGLALRNQGYSISYLGADCPVEVMREAAVAQRAPLVVITAATPERYGAVTDELRELAVVTRLCLTGAGATALMAERTGAERLEGDPVAAARGLGAR